MITLTAAVDPTCRAIAEFLRVQLSGLDAEAVEVETTLDYDGMIGGAAIDFPLLQVYRLSSRGQYLETTAINIDYYLYSVAALAERPGILRMVEIAIAHAIEDRLPYSGLSDWVTVEVESSARQFLRLESGEIFPLVRITAELKEINIVTPGTYIPIDLGGNDGEEPGPGGEEPGGGTTPPPITTASFETAFNQSSLSVAGVLVITHNLNSFPSGVVIWNGSGEVIMPDRVEAANANAIAVYLESFAPLAGQWRISVTQ